MDNAPVELANRIRSSVDDFFAANTKMIFRIEDAEMIIMGIAFGVMFLIAIFSFRPAVNQIFNEFELATAAIMSIPKEAVEANYGKMKEIMNVKEKKKKDKDKKKFGLSALPEDDIEDDSDDSDDDLLDNFETRENTHSRSQLYLVLTGQYCTALFFTAVIFAVVSTVLYLMSANMQQANVRTQLASNIGMLVWRVGYMGKMMSWDDQATYENVKSLRKVLRADFDECLELKKAFLFGSTKYQLDFSLVSEDIRHVLLDHKFMNDTYEYNLFMI